MNIKTSEATPLQLNWLVAKAEGLLCFGFIVDVAGTLAVINSDRQCEMFDPSSAWECGGPIIERERIGLWCDGGDGWAAEDYIHAPIYGPTPLIAAMRCYVASKLGEEVEIPEGLQ